MKVTYFMTITMKDGSEGVEMWIGGELPPLPDEGDGARTDRVITFSTKGLESVRATLIGEQVGAAEELAHLIKMYESHGWRRS